MKSTLKSGKYYFHSMNKLIRCNVVPPGQQVQTQLTIASLPFRFNSISPTATITTPSIKTFHFIYLLDELYFSFIWSRNWTISNVNISTKARRKKIPASCFSLWIVSSIFSPARVLHQTVHLKHKRKRYLLQQLPKHKQAFVCKLFMKLKKIQIER